MPKRKRAPEEAKPSQDADQKKDDTNTVQKPKRTFEISVEDKKPIQCERHGNPTSKPDLIFTHGAGGGLSAPAMQDFAAGFANSSNLVMFKGNMNLKSRVSHFQKVMEREACDPAPALGGRSMGARAACLAAQESESRIDALILVSFPLIGAQKGDSREQTLLDLPESIDVLFISGTDDTMCDLDHLHSVVGNMKARSWVVEVVGADHGMSVKGKGGSQAIRTETGEVAAEWLRNRDEGTRSLLLGWDGEEQLVVSEGWQEARHEANDDDGQSSASPRQLEE